MLFVDFFKQFRLVIFAVVGVVVFFLLPVATFARHDEIAGIVSSQKPTGKIEQKIQQNIFSDGLAVAGNCPTDVNSANNNYDVDEEDMENTSDNRSTVLFSVGIMGLVAAALIYMAAKKWHNLGDYADAIAGGAAQSCPRCQAVFGRDDHCNHVTCPGCRLQMCYVCRRPWAGHFGDAYTCQYLPRDPHNQRRPG